MDEQKRCISLPVASDQSGNYGKFVITSATGVTLLVTAGGAALGVLDSTDGDVLGKAVPVAYSGRTSVLAGATVVAGTLCASTVAGLAVTAVAADYVLGTFLSAGGSGDMVDVLLMPQGQINAA